MGFRDVRYLRKSQLAWADLMVKRREGCPCSKDVEDNRFGSGTIGRSFASRTDETGRSNQLSRPRACLSTS